MVSGEKKGRIVVDEEMDQILGSICDAALKVSGFAVLDDVNLLIRSLMDDEIEDEKVGSP